MSDRALEIPHQYDRQAIRALVERGAEKLIEDVIAAIGLPLSASKILLEMEKQDTAQGLRRTVEDSLYWNGLMDCAKVRYLGSAGMGTEPTNSYGKPHEGYAHVGLELWTTYSATPDQIESMRQANSMGRHYLKHFAGISALLSETRESWRRVTALQPSKPPQHTP